MTGRILVGDCVDWMSRLPDASVHCCVTSPPYWGLRDYGVDGQLGLEPTPEAYCQRMVEVFREVWRVLRDDGTLWLNVGDSYAATSACDRRSVVGQGSPDEDCARPNRGVDGLKPKDLVGIPWRLAFALQQDGWYLRSDIVWSKPNPMPESVTDRPTKSHEYVFLLTKRERYYWDQEAVREAGSGRCPGNKTYKYDGVAGHETKQGILAQSDVRQVSRNLRDVWTIPTESTAEAHFATMPCALVEPCIKAGTSERGCCPQCGAPWERVVEKERAPRGDRLGKRDEGCFDHGQQGTEYMMVTTTTTLGWVPTCKCDAGDPQLCTVLDPFFGAGTVGLVAERLGRSYIGIELNPEYAEIARRRIATNGKAKIVAPDPEDQGRLFGEDDAA